MAEQGHEPEPDAEGAPGGGTSAAAVALTLARTGADIDEDARTFLREHTKLLRLQQEDLHEQRELQLEHLKIRRWKSRLSLALEGLAVAAGLALVVALGIMAWQAHEDRGLVVETFSVPPDLAARGATGQALAAQLLDKLGEINAKASSLRAPTGYAADWGRDAKVEIPETGVSIGDLQRFLRGWLGHETHITGELMSTPQGLAMTIRAGDTPGRTLNVHGEDIPGLLQQAGESAFEATQPYRYSMYLLNTGRADQALAAARRLADGGPASERGWAWTQISNVLCNMGDALGCAQAGATAARYDFRLGLALINEGGGWAMLGRSEAYLRALREGVARLRSESADVDPSARRWLIVGNQGGIDELLGDRQASARANEETAANNPEFETFGPITQTAIAYELALNHDVAGSLRAYAIKPAPDTESTAQIGNWGDVLVSQYERAADVGDWAGALAHIEGAIAAAPRWPSLAAYAVPRFLKPRQAIALAHLGRKAEALEVAASLPTDCYRCLRARGTVAAAGRDWPEAQRWFAEAARQGPSLPFAYADWGQMLLDKGDVEGAIAKLQVANQKGPHFADALELWGEALMRKGDFKGAAAKFAEAARYAPAWTKNQQLLKQARGHG